MVLLKALPRLISHSSGLPFFNASMNISQESIISINILDTPCKDSFARFFFNAATASSYSSVVIFPSFNSSRSFERSFSKRSVSRLPPVPITRAANVVPLLPLSSMAFFAFSYSSCLMIFCSKSPSRAASSASLRSSALFCEYSFTASPYLRSNSRRFSKRSSSSLSSICRCKSACSCEPSA